MHEIIMGYQGEMSLKGLNRNQFESAMMKILRYRLKTVGKFKVYCTQSTFYMEPEEEDVDMDLAFDRVSKVFGLAALSRAVVCDKASFRRSSVGVCDLPDCLLCDIRHDCVRSNGRENKIQRLLYLFCSDLTSDLSGFWPLDLGRRMAFPDGIP